MDELRRLSRHVPTVVTPAFRDSGPMRELPPGVELDLSLADRPMFRVPSVPIMGSLIRRCLREIMSTPSLLVRPGAWTRIAGYLVRGSRTASWQLARARSGDQADQVLCYWSNSEAFGTAVARDLGLDSDVYCRVHGFDVDEPSYPGGHLPFRRDIVDAADRIVPVCEHGRRLLLERHPEAKERIRVARLGVCPPSLVGDGRESSKSNPGHCTVITVSNDAAVKRLDFVADAIMEASRNDSEVHWRWVHVGRGGDRLATRIGNDSELIFEPRGFLTQEQVFTTYVDVSPDVFVNLSSREGVPVSIMEALSMGVPVVATAAGGTGELVDEEVGALLPVDVGLNAAAEAIRRIGHASGSLRSAARERWSSSASDSIAERMLIEAIAP